MADRNVDYATPPNRPPRRLFTAAGWLTFVILCAALAVVLVELHDHRFGPNWF
jgi:hypothetical protein